MAENDSSGTWVSRLGVRTPLVIAAIAIFAGCLLVFLFAYLLFGNNDNNDNPSIGDATPTPFASPVAPFNPQVVSVQIGNSNAVSLTLDTPNFLTIGGRQFTVQTQPVDSQGVWTPVFGQETTSVWLQGAVVNYVFGLDDTTANRELIQGLLPGSEIVLETKRGVVYQFAFESRDTPAVADTSIYSQREPGITLILVGTEGQNRLVARGSYQGADGLISEPATDAFQLGELADVGDLQVSVTGATHLLDRPEAPVGFAFYLIDFQVRSLAVNSFDLSFLRLTLADDLGNQYANNPAAAQLGNYPPLGTVLGPGETTQATAGYQIPRELQSSALTLRVQRVDSGAEIEVRIPFTPTSDSADSVRVDLFSGEVSIDGTSLQLQGQITNSGDQTLVVPETGITLVSQGTVFLILSTNPGFPWIVNTGQTLPFSVSFQRPINADSAVFTVLNQSFSIEGLR